MRSTCGYACSGNRRTGGTSCICQPVVLPHLPRAGRATTRRLLSSGCRSRDSLPPVFPREVSGRFQRALHGDVTVAVYRQHRFAFVILYSQAVFAVESNPPQRFRSALVGVVGKDGGCHAALAAGNRRTPSEAVAVTFPSSCMLVTESISSANWSSVGLSPRWKYDFNVFLSLYLLSIVSCF